MRTKIVKKHGEYIVRAYDDNGKRLPNRDYFTDDRRDAEQTAELMEGEDMVKQIYRHRRD